MEGLIEVYNLFQSKILLLSQSQTETVTHKKITEVLAPKKPASNVVFYIIYFFNYSMVLSK